ncbi:hypothetical protein L3X38_003308 [Prunus dulcis]|uniref:Uncharacterized protein n=1 Tax=Prunus dulcis TaxID=3755 RepID=A0AAD5F1P0_PRUDU|nr:hypothetical protein L3X38_003308 [Prunus dulcis]
MFMNIEINQIEQQKNSSCWQEGSLGFEVTVWRRQAWCAIWARARRGTGPWCATWAAQEEKLRCVALGLRWSICWAFMPAGLEKWAY